MERMVVHRAENASIPSPGKGHLRIRCELQLDQFFRNPELPQERAEVAQEAHLSGMTLSESDDDREAPLFRQVVKKSLRPHIESVGIPLSERSVDLPGFSKILRKSYCLAILSCAAECSHT